jgi:hypothetical protein
MLAHQPSDQEQVHASPHRLKMADRSAMLLSLFSCSDLLPSSATAKRADRPVELYRVSTSPPDLIGGDVAAREENQ